MPEYQLKNYAIDKCTVKPTLVRIPIFGVQHFPILFTRVGKISPASQLFFGLSIHFVGREDLFHLPIADNRVPGKISVQIHHSIPEYLI